MRLPAGVTQRTWWPYLLMTLGVFFLASDVIVGRLAGGRDVPPLGLGFWRAMGPAIEKYVRDALVQKHISFPFPSRFKITESLCGYERNRKPLIGNA